MGGYSRMSQEEGGRKIQSMNLSPDPCIWDQLSWKWELPHSWGGLGSSHFGSWEVLWAGCPPTQLARIGPRREWGQVLVLADDLPEVQPESVRSGAGAFSCDSSKGWDLTDWASAAQALPLGPWHDAYPSLPGSSFPWH